MSFVSDDRGIIRGFLTGPDHPSQHTGRIATNMRLRTALAVFAVFVTACGGVSDVADTSDTTPEQAATEAPATEPPADEAPTETPTTAPEPDPPAPEQVTITSEDGNLSIVVGGAESAALSPTISILDPADWPAEVAGGANLDGVKIYELAPDGATFETPVTVTRRLDIASFGDLGPNDVPLITMLSHSEANGYELLGDLTALRVGNDLYMSGTTTHFSSIVTSSEGVTFPFDPPSFVASGGLGSVDISANHELDVSVKIGPIETTITVPDSYLNEGINVLPESRLHEAAGTNPFTGGADLVSEITAGPSTIDPLALDPSMGGYQPQVWYTPLTVPMSETPSAAALLGDAVDAERADVLFTAALLLASVPDEQLDGPVHDVTAFLGAFNGEVEMLYEVSHSRFGTYPSSTRKTYTGLPPIPSGHSLYSFSFQGNPSDSPPVVSIGEVIEGADGLSAQTGIECFCLYSEGLILVDGDLPPDLMAPGAGDNFWVFAAADPSVAFTLTVTDTQTGMIKTFDITAAEGPLFADTATFATAP